MAHEGSHPGRSATGNSNPVMTSSVGPVPRVGQITDSMRIPPAYTAQLQTICIDTEPTTSIGRYRFISIEQKSDNFSLIFHILFNKNGRFFSANFTLPKLFFFHGHLFSFVIKYEKLLKKCFFFSLIHFYYHSILEARSRVF